MNIEKIKNYNHKVLAALGTILVIFAFTGLVALIIFLVTEIMPHNFDESTEILSQESIDKLKEKGQVQEIVSYGSPYLADTNRLIYIIPVNIKILDEPEYYDDGVLGISGKRMGSGKSFSPGYYQGNFSNLLIYNYKIDSVYNISNKYFYSRQFEVSYFKDETLIVFKAAEKDSNGDGYIRNDDAKSLFVYSIEKKHLRIVSHEKSTLTNYEFVAERKDMLLTFGFDRTKDNYFDGKKEPSVVMKYNYEREILSPLVNNALEMELKKIRGQ